MDNWDDDGVDWEDAPADTGFGWDDDTTAAAEDDWEVAAEPAPAPVVTAKPVAAPKPAAKAKPAAAKGKKLSLKDALKLREEEEARNRANASAAGPAVPLTKEEERKLMEQSNLEITSDLFAGCSKPTGSDNPESQSSSSNLERAAALAASSGLTDGYDGVVDASGVPEAKTGAAAPPSVLDALNLNDKDVITKFAGELTLKIKNYNNSAMALLLLKEIVNGIGPTLKIDHVQELFRVVTVQKTAAADALKNKKKSNKKPALAKDREADIYDDFY